jgi:hypothetical protein
MTQLCAGIKKLSLRFVSYALHHTLHYTFLELDLAELPPGTHWTGGWVGAGTPNINQTSSH